MTRYNYTSAEKFAMVEILAMLKSTQTFILRLEKVMSEGIARHIYVVLQHFVQRQLREPLRKAAKHKKEVIKM